MPERLKRYVDKIAAQPREQVEKKAKRLGVLAWFWVALLILIGGNYLLGVWSGKAFSWTEATARTLPFITMAAIMATTRDTMLIVLIMREKEGSQPPPAN